MPLANHPSGGDHARTEEQKTERAFKLRENYVAQKNVRFYHNALSTKKGLKIEPQSQRISTYSLHYARRQCHGSFVLYGAQYLAVALAKKKSNKTNSVGKEGIRQWPPEAVPTFMTRTQFLPTCWEGGVEEKGSALLMCQWEVLKGQKILLGKNESFLL